VSPEREAIAQYWRTAICDIKPGSIAFRGYPIQSLIGRLSFCGMIWLLLRGELASDDQAALLEAAMVASVDHGPHAPGIAIARMAVTTGLPLNGAIASAVNTLDDVHGGAGEQAIELFEDVLARSHSVDLEGAARAAITTWMQDRSKYLPGFGHRFHPVDPRVEPLLGRVDIQVTKGVIQGRYAAAARSVCAALAAMKGKQVPMNVDGVTAVIFAELGFAPPLARGLFCISRSVGILAHAWEQTGRGERNKGPIPRDFSYAYVGPSLRDLPEPQGGTP